MTEIINNNRPTYENRRRKGTGFTNTQDLVESNKNNKLGETVTSGLQKDIKSNNIQIGKSVDNFQQEADKTRLSWDNQGKEVEDTLNQLDTATTDEEANSYLDNIKSNISKYNSGNYTGPTELEDTDSLYSKTKALSQLTKSANTEGGRRGLLNQTFGNTNDYSVGKNKLDSMLLGKTGSDSIKSLSKKARQSTDNIINQRDIARNNARNYKIDTRNFANRYNQEVSGRTDNIKNDIQDRIDNSYKYSQADLLKKIYEDNDGIVDQNVLAAIDPNLTRTYGLDLNNFQGINRNVNNVASIKDSVRMDALNRLLGNENSNYFNRNVEDFGSYYDTQNQRLIDDINYNKTQYDRRAEDLKTSSAQDMGNKVNNLNYERMGYWTPGNRLTIRGPFGGTSAQQPIANRLEQYGNTIDSTVNDLQKYITSGDKYVKGSYEDLINKYNIDPNLLNNQEFSNEIKLDSLSQDLNNYNTLGTRAANPNWIEKFQNYDKGINNKMALTDLFNKDRGVE